ncbi:Major allergen Pru ar 1 [Vitis vinifera]|uniref:Major allergen Pru ar 1 n=1 Tax=Vitis vinifera TaxID=29760 RepID=A0A438FXY9_VITVI|nr:Major allergen Pru ar 1 [Vitis vinifera]
MGVKTVSNEFSSPIPPKSVCKSSSHYHTKGDIELKDEDIQAGKDKALAAYKVVEDHLAANPSVCA